MNADYSPAIKWVREREAIRERKDMGLAPPPWTADPILQKFRFCNVRREDDRVTVWIRENIRKPYNDHPLLWLMLCIARQINWPDTLRELIERGAWPSAEGFTPAALADALNDRQSRGEKVYTGAYMISAPPGKGADKQRYIAEQVIGGLWKRRDTFAANFGNALPSLYRIHELIMRTNGWGPFMAYQAVVDMRFTRLLERAPDLARWAAAGPGTIRGLNRMHGRALDAALTQERALLEMRAMAPVLQRETGVAFDFSDVPNICCETDKYLRVQNGEGKPRALYVPGRGA